MATMRTLAVVSQFSFYSARRILDAWRTIFFENAVGMLEVFIATATAFFDDYCALTLQAGVNKNRPP
jgi:hypothetical protein